LYHLFTPFWGLEIVGLSFSNICPLQCHRLQFREFNIFRKIIIGCEKFQPPFKKSPEKSIPGCAVLKSGLVSQPVVTVEENEHRYQKQVPETSTKRISLTKSRE